MFESIAYVDEPGEGEVWVFVRDTTVGLCDWVDVRPHVLPKYRTLPLVRLDLYVPLGVEAWVLSSAEHGTTYPVRCRACIRRVMSSVLDDEPMPPRLIADDPAGVYGWAWCPTCGERSFIPMTSQEVGAELTHDIDRTGSVPVLVEVFR